MSVYRLRVNDVRHAVLRRLPTALAIGLFALMAWAPVAAWLAVTVSSPAAEAWRLAVPDGRRLQVLGETVFYALGVAAAASVIGSAAALYCWRRRSLLARAADRMAVLALPFPPYLHALAWLPLLAVLPGGGAGWWSAGWVQTLAMLPIAFGLTRVAMARLDERWIEAARIYGDDRRLLVRVLVPMLAAPALAGFSSVFLLTLVDPSAPSLFSCSAYPLEIFADFSARHDPARALWMSTPLILAGLLALEPVRRYWRALAQRPARARRELAPLQLPVLGIGAALAVVPVLALFAAVARQAWPPEAFGSALALAWPDLWASTASACAAAVIILPAAVVVSRYAVGGGAIGWWAIAAPLAAPGALSGAGLIWLWNRDVLWTPYGTFWMLPLAALARFAPLAVLAVAAWRSRLDPTLLEAARIYAPPWRGFVRVELPLLAPGLAAGAAIVFALSLAELPATVLVVPPGGGTLALRLYNYLHYGASGPVAVLSLCLMCGTASATWVAVWLWRRVP